MGPKFLELIKNNPVATLYKLATQYPNKPSWADMHITPLLTSTHTSIFQVNNT